MQHTPIQTKSEYPLPGVKLCPFLRGVEWVHGLFLFPLVLGKM